MLQHAGQHIAPAIMGGGTLSWMHMTDLFRLSGLQNVVAVSDGSSPKSRVFGLELSQSAFELVSQQVLHCIM